MKKYIKGLTYLRTFKMIFLCYEATKMKKQQQCCMAQTPTWTSLLPPSKPRIKLTTIQILHATSFLFFFLYLRQGLNSVALALLGLYMV